MFAPVLLSLISISNRAISFSLGIRRRRAQRMFGRLSMAALSRALGLPCSYRQSCIGAWIPWWVFWQK